MTMPTITINTIFTRGYLVAEALHDGLSDRYATPRVEDYDPLIDELRGFAGTERKLGRLRELIISGDRRKMTLESSRLVQHIAFLAIKVGSRESINYGRKAKDILGDMTPATPKTNGVMTDYPPVDMTQVDDAVPESVTV